MEDSQILDLYFSGEKNQAFNILVRKYSERLYWHIRRMVVVHDDADDCLQNSFIKIWNGLDNFRRESNLYTWMYRIATNETISFLTKKKNAEFLSGDALVGYLSNDPYFDGDAAQKALQRAIAKLPPVQKAVFTLRYYEEMPYKDMVEVLGSTEGSLKASYHQAYQKVSEWVQQLMTK